MSSPFKPFNRLKQCRHGMLLYNPRDLYVGQSLDRYGEYSEGEVRLFQQILKPGMIVVEAGANIGAHTVFLAQAVWPGGGVLAFEPQRLLHQTLCANIALNHIPNVDCRHQALGKDEGELRVPTLDPHQSYNFGGLELGSQDSGDYVPVVALDSFELPCALIKIDVEGMEYDVLEGARETISRYQPILYVENDPRRTERFGPLLQLMDRLGYDMYWHEPPLFNPDNFAGNPENVFGEIVSPNMICCPKSREHRVTGFAPVEIPRG